MNLFFAKRAALLGAALSIPVITACGEDGLNPAGDLCCTDFKPGQSMLNVDFVGDAQVNGQFRAFAQASGDLSVTASAAITDVTNACMAIAVDLGTEPDDPGANGKTGANLASFWCDKAIASINASLSASGSAKASLTIDFQPPKCSASIQAQANCQASCSAEGKCDIKANPPKCTGGTLEVACKGECTAKAGASLTCEGSCTGDCKGSCTAQGGVDCQGKCEGTCEAKAGVAGSGAQADGTCKGTCKGSCSVTAPAAKCSGSCKGECSASCKAEAGASVTCNGECKADYEPLQCTGGKLEGGCKVEAKCEGNCNASASAKAEFTPPELRIVASASASGNAKVGAVIDTLKVNLPKLIVVAQARGQAFIDTAGVVVEGGASITASGKLNVKGTACLIAAGAAAAAAVADMKVAVEQSVKVVGTVK
jgi:hypothetical protein